MKIKPVPKLVLLNIEINEKTLLENTYSKREKKKNNN
jgi:hypothetical protein